MDLNVCSRFKTFREELPTKKFQFTNENDSIHRMKIIHENANNQNKSCVADVDDVVEVQEPEEIKEKCSTNINKSCLAMKEDIMRKPVCVINPTPELLKRKGELSPNVGHPVIIEKTAITGLFRNSMRRIDLVLVVEDNPLSKADSLKIDFLTNVTKTGLEVEIEPGLMPAHKNLSFIKIHAPDNVITEYGEIFGVKRYFTENHLDSTSLDLTRIKKIFNTVLDNREKECIKIIRNNYSTPKGFSYLERSHIVYKILLHLPFGDQANHYGINCLLQRNIILDAYALHDGPYFFIPDQTVLGSNARQILYYSWIGVQNLFKSQPLHFIHEYFGPNIAFYFAFYGYLNKALAIAAIGGIINSLLPLIYGEEVLRKTICKEPQHEMCPQCENIVRCPNRNTSEYCIPMTMNAMLDYRYTVYFSLFILLWVQQCDTSTNEIVKKSNEQESFGLHMFMVVSYLYKIFNNYIVFMTKSILAFTFITFWKRKEYFLKWMWELNGIDLYYKSTYRPEFEIKYKPLRKSFQTGLKYNENIFYKISRFVLTKGTILLFVWSILPIMATSSNMHDHFFDSILTRKKIEKWWDYVILAMFQTLYILAVSVLEKICHYLSYIVVHLFENHSTYKAYDESLAMKEFGFSFISIYSFMAYIAWMVAGRRIFLGRCVGRYKKIGTISFLHDKLSPYTISPWASTKQCTRYCWPFTCINEVGVMLAVALFVKQVAYRAANYIYSLRTDYNRSKEVNATIPCWEREYTLNRVDEGFLFKRYHMLAIQFSTVTLFVVSFPLAPLVVLLVNICDLRHTARQLLLSSRRPLLIRKPGIGAWNKFFTFIAFIAILTNAATLVFTTRLITRYFLESENVSQEDYLKVITSYLERKPEFQKNKCYSDDMLENDKKKKDYWKEYFWGLENEMYFKYEYYLLNIYKIIFLFIFIHVTGLLFFLIKLLFPPYIREIKETKVAEKRIKTLFFHYKAANKFSKVTRT